MSHGSKMMRTVAVSKPKISVDIGRERELFWSLQQAVWACKKSERSFGVHWTFAKQTCTTG